jgi:hypothetical protein
VSVALRVVAFVLFVLAAFVAVGDLTATWGPLCLPFGLASWVLATLVNDAPWRRAAA